MEEQLIAGLFVVTAAVISAWAIQGGRERRARIAIREELEMLGQENLNDEHRSLLERRVGQRLERYLQGVKADVSSSTQARSRSDFVWTVLGAVLLVVAAVLAVGVAFSSEEGEELESALANLAAGFALTGAWVFASEARAIKRARGGR